jgi:Uma2 family endonuclease
MTEPRQVARPAPDWSIDRLRKHFGMIPAERIVLDPAPGTAKEKDVTYFDDHCNRLCELVDGVLLEKPMGAKESMLAIDIGYELKYFQRRRKLGLVLGPDGFLRLVPGLVRAPDVSFVSLTRLPGGKLPDEAIPHLSPDLAVEILSKSNTWKEIQRKLREYFENGVRLVWVVHPRKRCVDVYTSAAEHRRVTAEQTLDGGDVLPGFRLPLAKLFGG